MPLPTDPEERILTDPGFRQAFVHDVIPNDLSLYLDCLTRFDEEEIQCEVRNKGNLAGAKLLLDRVRRKPDCINKLITALEHPNINLKHLADKLEDLKRTLGITLNLHMEDEEGTFEERGELQSGVEVDISEHGVIDLDEQQKLEGSKTLSHCHTSEQPFHDGQRSSFLPRPTSKLEQASKQHNESKKHNTGSNIDIDTIKFPTPGSSTEVFFKTDDTRRKRKYAVPEDEEMVTKQTYSKRDDREKHKYSRSEERERTFYKFARKSMGWVQSSQDVPLFLENLKAFGTILTSIQRRSIVLMLQLSSKMALENLENDYKHGALQDILSKDVITPARFEDVRKEATANGVNLKKMSLNPDINERHLLYCKARLIESEEIIKPLDMVESIILNGLGRSNQNVAAAVINTYRNTYPRVVLDMMQDPLLKTDFVQHIHKVYGEIAKNAQDTPIKSALSERSEKTIIRHMRWILSKLEMYLEVRFGKQRKETEDEMGSRSELYFLAAVMIGNICLDGDDFLKTENINDGQRILMSDEVHKWFEDTIQTSAIKRPASRNLSDFSLKLLAANYDGHLRFQSSILRDYVIAELLFQTKNDQLKTLVSKNVNRFQYIHVFCAIDDLQANSRPRRLSLLNISEIRIQSEQMFYEAVLFGNIWGRSFSDWGPTKEEFASLQNSVCDQDRLKTRNLLSVEGKHFLSECLKINRLDYVIETDVPLDVEDKIAREITGIGHGQGQGYGGEHAALISNHDKKITVKCWKSICRILQVLEYLDHSPPSPLQHRKRTIHHRCPEEMQTIVSDQRFPTGLLESISGAATATKLSSDVSSIPEIEESFLGKDPSPPPETGGFAVALKENQTISAITLSVSDVDLAFNAEMVLDLETTLMTMPLLTKLSIVKTSITFQALQRLLRACSRSKLAQLDISENTELHIDDKLGLQFTPNLRSFAACRLSLTDHVCATLAEELRDLEKLKTIDLSNNHLTQLGIGYVCRALDKHLCISSVNFSSNSLGLLGGYRIAYLLESVPFLEELKVDDCSLGESLLSITNALSGTNIKELSLAGNGICSVEFCSLLEMLSEKSLQSLCLSRNLGNLELSERIQQLFVAFLQSEHSLDDLLLEDCSSIANFILTREEKLPRLEGLSKLVLSEHSAGPNLPTFLRHHCKYLIYLDIARTRISSDVLKELSETLATKIHLERLIMDGNQLTKDDITFLLKNLQHSENLVLISVKSILQSDETKQEVAEQFGSSYMKGHFFIGKTDQSSELELKVEL